MKKVRLGILSPSEIAVRRFLPAIPDTVEFVGIAVASFEEWNIGETKTSKESYDIINKTELVKSQSIIEKYGGILFNSYEELLSSGIDAVYVPLPPSLHYYWSKKALSHNVNVLCEKPLTTSFTQTKDLIDFAKLKKLIIYENYAFEFHNQINTIKSIISSGKLGKIRTMRSAFSFPFRGKNDFRYNKVLGGGALNDCGGYPIKLATLILGKESKIKYSSLTIEESMNVDINGSAIIANNDNDSMYISFGMDNVYRCELEVCGSENSLKTERVFSAPADYVCSITISGKLNEVIEIQPDDSFKNSIKRFLEFVKNKEQSLFDEILLQDKLMDDIRNNNLGGNY